MQNKFLTFFVPLVFGVYHSGLVSKSVLNDKNDSVFLYWPIDNLSTCLP